ncbi:patatin-like phospholipase, partial [Trifolium pratense]
ALVAVSEVLQELNEKIPQFIHVNPNEPIKLVLLSLGCGRTETQGIDPRIAQFFSFNDWIPVTVVGLTTSAADINEYHLALVVFPDLPSSENYHLRIEVHE